MQSWRNLMGYVKQDIFLMDASIGDNITFGDENPDEFRLKQAIKQASLEDLIQSLQMDLTLFWKTRIAIIWRSKTTSRRCTFTISKR